MLTRWSSGSNTAWSSVEMNTVGQTHPTLPDRFWFLLTIVRSDDSHLRVFLSILFRLSDPSENWVLGYFGYADFKNLISFALGRRILEIAIFARNTVLQVLIIKKTLETYIARICVKNHTRQEFYIRPI